MTKLFGGLLGFLSWLWLLASGVILVLIAVLDRSHIIRLMNTYQANIIILIIGIALGLLAYMLLRVRWMRLRHRKEIVYANALGEISVSLTAIEEAMERVLDKVEIIRSHAVIIQADAVSKKLVIRAEVFILEVDRVTLKGGDIQQKLAKRFEEIMPDADTPDIKVKIVNFSDQGAKKERSHRSDRPQIEEKSTSKSDETDYFTGLKYPIDTGDEDE